jgi:hypothetical protein
LNIKIRFTDLISIHNSLAMQVNYQPQLLVAPMDLDSKFHTRHITVPSNLNIDKAVSSDLEMEVAGLKAVATFVVP